jgi:hypothetical protein
MTLNFWAIFTRIGVVVTRGFCLEKRRQIIGRDIDLHHLPFPLAKNQTGITLFAMMLCEIGFKHRIEAGRRF